MVAETKTTSLIQALKNICGENVFYDDESLNHYGHDETEKLLYPPDVVVKPTSTKEISKILKYCNEHLIPVTPRGAGTGLSGGAIPHKGGVVISTEKLNKILIKYNQNKTKAKKTQPYKLRLLVVNKTLLVVVFTR